MKGDFSGLSGTVVSTVSSIMMHIYVTVLTPTGPISSQSDLNNSRLVTRVSLLNFIAFGTLSKFWQTQINFYSLTYSGKDSAC